MDEIMVVYWSQTGNTEAMAQAVAQGIEEAGKKAKEYVVTAIQKCAVDHVAESTISVVQLPSDEMEPFVAEVEGFASGKTIGLFGSYGWGDGQWMRDWEDRMKAAGAEVACGEGIITQETPDDDALVKCKELGKTLAAV